MPGNVQAQRGWLVLSPLAEQVVVHTGHAVEEVDPDLVRDAILDVVEAARIEATTRIVFKRLEAGRHHDLRRESRRQPGDPAVRGGSGGRAMVADGTEIAIFCCDDGMAAHILDAETGALRTLPMPDPGLETFCGGPWSPDGERLICEGFRMDDPDRNGIYTIRASDGGGLKRITTFPPTSSPRTARTSPATTPPTGSSSCSCAPTRKNPPGLFVTNVDGTGLRRLTPRT